ncbi:uncharacterized protein LOC107491051 isoform X1 [Arachis duranensis]|uniref:Uncharacterized protein LOC107491051 isoform X1 n=1 Tax=Arachis duranensis TaxID=130453 RepID=A0A9C6TVQ8_ARADU|nr:uncharacterized protein LOC107491051 isoform X1 [Arachis duranensis]
MSFETLLPEKPNERDDTMGEGKSYLRCRQSSYHRQKLPPWPPPSQLLQWLLPHHVWPLEKLLWPPEPPLELWLLNFWVLSWVELPFLRAMLRGCGCCEDGKI